MAIELLQQLRADLVASGGGGPVAVEAKAVVRRGRPPGKKAARSAWTGMSAEERSIEMKRRMAVSQAKRGVKVKIPGLHPRDPKHPGHDAWVEKMRASQKRQWAAISPAQRKTRQRKMQKGRMTAREAINEIQVAS